MYPKTTIKSSGTIQALASAKKPSLRTPAHERVATCSRTSSLPTLSREINATHLPDSPELPRLEDEPELPSTPEILNEKEDPDMEKSQKFMSPSFVTQGSKRLLTA